MLDTDGQHSPGRWSTADEQAATINARGNSGRWHLLTNQLRDCEGVARRRRREYVLLYMGLDLMLCDRVRIEPEEWPISKLFNPSDSDSKLIFCRGIFYTGKGYFRTVLGYFRRQNMLLCFWLSPHNIVLYLPYNTQPLCLRQFIRAGT